MKTLFNIKKNLLRYIRNKRTLVRKNKFEVLEPVEGSTEILVEPNPKGKSKQLKTEQTRPLVANKI